METNIPAKFARQRTLSESSTESLASESSASESSAASGLSAASGSSKLLDSYSVSGSSASCTGIEDENSKWQEIDSHLPL